MKIGFKVIFVFVLIVVLSATAWICLTKPVMHKPFSVNTIEYLLKVNKDGSVSTTKKVTKTVIKGETNE